MWFQLAILVISYLVSAALAPKPPKLSPAGLGDIEAPTAEEGRPIPVIFGTVKVSGPNVVWYGDMAVKEIKESTGK